MGYDCGEIRWDELTPDEKLNLIPDILYRLKLEIWFGKFDGDPRSIELRQKRDDD